MSELNIYFQERLKDVDAYITFLESLDRQISHSKLENAQTVRTTGSIEVTVQQQRILYSSVYVQLYNLVESTINQSILLIKEKIIHQNIKPRFLRDELLKEWVKNTAKTHIEMDDDKRLEKAFGLCQCLFDDSHITEFEISIGGGGNWDDEKIYDLAKKKIGLTLDLTDDTQKRVKRPFKDNDGVIKCIKTFRNKLAHGNISFSDCGEDLDINRLKELRDITVSYLNEIVDNFSSYIGNNEFRKNNEI